MTGGGGGGNPSRRWDDRVGLLPRNERLVDAIVDVAGTARPELDVTEVLYSLAATAVDLLDAETAGVQIAGEVGGRLGTAAMCGEDGRYSVLFDDHGDDGPGEESYRRAEVVSWPDLTVDPQRWPTFTARALRLGFHSVHGIPVRTRDHVLGALSLARSEAGPLVEADLAIAQCLATVAAVSIVGDRARHDEAELRRQLEEALQSRILVEQAKGYLARHYHETPNQAFVRLRAYARTHRRRIAAVAEDVVSHRLDLG